MSELKKEQLALSEEDLEQVVGGNEENGENGDLGDESDEILQGSKRRYRW